ncbi:MAG: glycoside hydrolase family 28 protein [Terracidiphilus sp.]
MERRDFLKRAAQGAFAVPAAASLGNFGLAQTAKPAKAPTNGTHATAEAHAGPKVTINVKDLGATGDGKTKDTLALQLAIDRCAALGGGEVVVPAGDYATGGLALRSDVTLRIEDGASLLGSGDMADYPVTEVRWEGRWIKGYSAFISAVDAENVGIAGPGEIVASDAIRGRVERPSGMRLPALLEFTNCRNVRVENCFTSQAGMWSIHPVYCENVTFSNVTINSGADGIDVDSCKHTVIDGCTFDTADDCISLKSGRGEEAYTINRPCEDVRISNCAFNDRTFACIGIGSETSAGVKDVVIEHCKCVGARSHAVYIKSRPGRGAYVENISVNDMDVSGMRQGFLRLNNLNSGKQDEFPVPGDAGIPEFRNFRFSNIRVTDVPVLVQGVEIHPRKPLVGLTLANITGTCKAGIALANMKSVVIRGIKVSGFEGPLLAIANVSGVGLEGAVKLDPAKMPKVPDAVPVPEKPYELK